MESSPAEQSFSLVPLRRRREELRESMTRLEAALAKSAVADADSWLDGVRTELVALSTEWRMHVEITEGDDGLYREILDTAPRLSDAVRHLADEHAEISELVDALLPSVGTPGSEPDVARVRELGTALLLRLMRHRQRGSDLVYDAFEFDIGGDT